MSTPRTDRAPRPSAARPTRAALFRRRVVALLLLLGLVVGLVLLGQVVVRAVQPMLAGGETPEEGKSAPPTPDASGPPQDCAATSLELGLSPSAAEYEPGRVVQLSVSVRQTGGRPCLVDGSDAGRQVLVYAGDELVWSSAHCGSTDRLLLMSQGDEDPSKIVRWDRHRSAEGCAPDQPEVGPGTYTAVLDIAGVQDATSEPVTFTLAAPPPPPEPTEAPDPEDPAASDPAAGDPAAGDPAAGDPGSGDPGSGDTVEGDPAAGTGPAPDPAATE